MTQVSIPGGLWFPFDPGALIDAGLTTTAGTMDATGEKVGFLGHVYIEGRATNKVISTGKIHWRSGNVTFANAGTSLDVGLQNVDITTGAPVRPDETFDVKTTFTGGGAGVTANAVQSSTMTTGTMTLSHGDRVGVVWDMVARAGADSVVVAAKGGVFPQWPVMVLKTAGTWAWQTGVPICAIEFDDGTLGYIEGGYVSAATGNLLWADADNPDERGLMFELPWDCKLDAIGLKMAQANATTADATATLISDPLGTPSVLATFFTASEQLGGLSSVIQPSYFLAASEISISKNIKYGIVIKGTGAANFRLGAETLLSAAFRSKLPGGTACKYITRNGGSGAFAEESPNVTVPYIGGRFSSFEPSAGGGAHILGGSIVR